MDILFFKIFETLTNDDNIKYSDICVMAVIATLAQTKKDKTVVLSAADIHKRFPRVPIRTIIDSINRLSQNKYVEIIKNKGCKNKYKVLFDIPYIPPKQKKYTTKQKPHTDFDGTEKYNVCINNFTVASDNKGGDNI